MKILALELSSARGSVALLNNHEIEFSREWPNDRKNSGPFFEYLVEMQKQLRKPDTIIVGLGPGSYAGTRIAISAAIGLSFGARRAVNASPARTAQKVGHDSACPSIRLIGYPSICTIECDVAEYCVIGDARRQTFFYARVQKNNLASQTQSSSVSAPVLTQERGSRFPRRLGCPLEGRPEPALSLSNGCRPDGMEPVPPFG